MTVVAKNDVIQIERRALGPFETNSYLLTCLQTRDSVLVDAPGEAQEILTWVEKTNPRYIVMTHSHMDHTGALLEVRDALKIPLAAHSRDAKSLPCKPDIFLNDGDKLSFGAADLTVLHTPGHTPGSLCFLTGRYLIAGDTIFPGGPGRTPSPDALKQIIESITSKIFVLPEETTIYSGHGDSSTIVKEKAQFAEFSSRPHDPHLCGDVLWLSS
jgi:glyoxylase-like metal-dependent hydrolase (beta-lactamase superfamily II)